MKSRIIKLLLISMSLMLALLLTSCGVKNINEVYVSPKGSDFWGNGTKSHPYKSIEKVQEIVRNNNTDMKSDIMIYLCKGTYSITKTINLSEKDSGSNGFFVRYKAVEGEHPVVSGGVKLNKFKLDSKTGLWKIENVKLKEFRQLYVNGKRAIRAKAEENVQGLEFYNAKQNKFTGKVYGRGEDIVSFEVNGADGIVVDKVLVERIKNPDEMELVWPTAQWRHFRIMATDIINYPNDENKKIIKLKNPDYDIALSLGNEAGKAYVPWFDTNFYFENDISLLDKPGEWYYDKKASVVYYSPLEGENISTSTAFAPQLDVLLNIAGDDTENKIKNVEFDGISFVCSSWLRVNQAGFAPVQAEQLTNRIGPQPNELDEIYLVDGAIKLDCADNVNILNCRVEHIGGAGIQLKNGVTNCNFVGNVISDISDTAFLVGYPTHDKIDKKNEQAPTNIVIRNNLIRTVGIEYYSAPAISSYYTDNLQIVHNDISDMPYSGISLGWGWTLPNEVQKNNLIAFNRIYDYLKQTTDGGGVYILGHQKGGTVEGNYIYNQNHPQHAAVYYDNGADHFITRNNVMDNVAKWVFVYDDQSLYNLIENNYTNSTRFSVSNEAYEGGPPENNILRNNKTISFGTEWPNEAKAIIEKSGLEQNYRYLSDKVNIMEDMVK